MPRSPAVMAVVPFRVSGAAADQSLEQRLFQIGPYALFIKQNPKVELLLMISHPMNLRSCIWKDIVGTATQKLFSTTSWHLAWAWAERGPKAVQLVLTKHWRRGAGHITPNSLMT